MEGLSEEASKLVEAAYIQQGCNNLRTRQKTLQNLLIHKKLPAEGLDDPTIEFMLSELATMDSNNFSANAGVGEREGRVFSSIVSRRHYHMSHGIGRSGDIAEVQPKAAGSSLMYKLATGLTKHALQISGAAQKHCLLLPLATGMSLNMCLLQMRKRRPQADIVIFPRIDQKSCFKSILTAGLHPIVIDNILTEDGSMETDVTAVAECMAEYTDRVLCVLSTTSCFAPRQPDKVDELARLCKDRDVGHIINNAYGTQCQLITKLINRADVVGRVDAVVQSTDKNFMVPVGGAIVTSSQEDFIASLSAMYPGRASATPVLDLFITLLAMGERKYRYVFCYTSIFLSSCLCAVSVSVSVSHTIYYCPPAFFNTTWHESNHHPPPQSINQSITNRHNTYYNTGTCWGGGRSCSSPWCPICRTSPRSMARRSSCRPGIPYQCPCH